MKKKRKKKVSEKPVEKLTWM